MEESSNVVAEISVWLTIGIGVGTGIAASILFGLLKQIWKKIIEPYFINSLYKDVDITGKWRVVFPVKKKLRVKSNDIMPETEDPEETGIKRLPSPEPENEPNNKPEKGTGFVTITIGVSNEYIATIDRKGEIISGQLTGIKGGDEGRIYKINGTFRNLILVAEIDSENQKCLERGSMSLMLKRNGNEMVGSYSMYEDDLHSIVSMKTVFERIKS